jgi:FkbM family methyltransferase
MGLSTTGKPKIEEPEASQEPLRPNRAPIRQLKLEQNGHTCVLVAPPEHRLDVYRAAGPLYDQRLPLLSRIVAIAAPSGVIIDVGANIGDTVALCRMAGCESPIIAIEPSERYFAFLEANRQALPELFRDVRTLRAFIGAGNENLSIIEGAGTAHVEITQKAAKPDASSETPTLPLSGVTEQQVSLIKTDTDGYDAAILSGSINYLRRARPIIWSEAEVSELSDEDCWRKLCIDLAESHPQMCIFDNFGFLIAHGAVADKQGTFLDLLKYTRQHRAAAVKLMGPPTIYYVDVVFFPSDKFDVYTSFVNQLMESRL